MTFVELIGGPADGTNVEVPTDPNSGLPVDTINLEQLAGPIPLVDGQYVFHNAPVTVHTYHRHNLDRGVWQYRYVGATPRPATLPT